MFRKKNKICEIFPEQPKERSIQTASSSSVISLPDLGITTYSKKEKRIKLKDNSASKTIATEPYKTIIYFGDLLSCSQSSINVPSSPKQSTDVSLEQRSKSEKTKNKIEDIVEKKMAICKCSLTEHFQSSIKTVQNDVLNIQIAGDYKCARALVKTILKTKLAVVDQPLEIIRSENNNADDSKVNSNSLKTSSSHNNYCDWNTVQDGRRALQWPALAQVSELSSIQHHQTIKTPSFRLQKGMVTESNTYALKKSQCDFRGLESSYIQPIAIASASEQIAKSAIMHRASNGKAPLCHTAQSTSEELQSNTLLKSELQVFHRIKEYYSSSDENQSSGRASMSDTGGHCSTSPMAGTTLSPLFEDRLAVGVTNRNIRSRCSQQNARPRHRSMPATTFWCGNDLEDVKLAFQKLTVRSQTSASTYSSLSARSESSEPTRRLGARSSLETLNTNETEADEFIWLEGTSHSRLVELQNPPWTQYCIWSVIHKGRCKELSSHITNEVIPRLGYLLQRALVRIAREIQRFSATLGLCSKQEVACAFKVVLCTTLADSSNKACLRASTMFAVPGDRAFRQSKSARAGLLLSVGRFYRWMTDTRLGKFIHEYAAVYLCAGIENLLEEIILQCNISINQPLTVNALDQSIASSGEFCSLLQPYTFLNAGRIASGVLTMTRWASQSSLITCVGSITELKEKAQHTQNKFNFIPLSEAGLTGLYYFMRCSQLEHSELLNQKTSNPGAAMCGNVNHTIQELCYERAYVVLPPLIEWLRVASAHAEYRNSLLIDKDDIIQAARVLLPGVDCPIRPVANDEELPNNTNGTGTSLAPMSSAYENSSDLARRATIDMAFKLLLTGRVELVAQAKQFLPVKTRYDTLNHSGLTALMIASIRNDEVAIQALLDAGCDPNVEVPPAGSPSYPSLLPDTQHWTAVTFAASRSNYVALRILLERGGKADGGARSCEDRCTLTPLQVASGAGNLDIITLLLAHGASAFLSTKQEDVMCVGSAQKGCFCAISVAAIHGHRACLRKLLSHPVSPGTRDVLSLEEMLNESDFTVRGFGIANDSPKNSRQAAPNLLLLPTKIQIKCLQEAMYHSAETNHLDITMELRNYGVPWTLYCWMKALSAAHELFLDVAVEQLLQDFLQVFSDDYTEQFIDECLPLLFNIFRYYNNEGISLLLADIFTTCFGWVAPLPLPSKELVLQPVHTSRIDLKFVNSPELSDVIFRVEGRIFYGHKIVLVTASPRFESMLNSKSPDAAAPTVQINDMRYRIFYLIMHYLYSGECSVLDVSQHEVLELLAAASFFQLEKLVRFTEARCSELVNIDNVVAMYIHAKIYNAENLLEYCQGFLLQNMVALLTYDDSAKRLLLTNKLPDHNVMGELLNVLQKRLRSRKSNGFIAHR